MTAERSATTKRGRVLIIAGSDPSGGAGVQADVKTVTACGGYAATAITAITVQNTVGVQAVAPLDTNWVGDQIRAIVEDIGVDAVKVGMLHSAEHVVATAEALSALDEDIPLVLDPVMAATTGARLTPDRAIEESKRHLFLRAQLITPNTVEAEVLTRLSIGDLDAMRRAGERMLSFGCEAALIKGGHLPGDVVRDVLVTFDGETVFESPRIPTRHTHGTGCTLSSAVATHLARGEPMETAVEKARNYVWEALKAAPQLGEGQGPLDHGWCARAAYDAWTQGACTP